MEETITNEMPATSDETSLEENYSYVLHGAQAVCEFCSRPGRLTVPLCHGTYMHDMPVMTVDDAKPQTNVKYFGFCSSMTNPDRLKAVEAVMEQVEDSKNLLDHIMDFPGKVKSLFEKDAVDPNDPYHGYGRDVYENVTVMCNPEFDFREKWEGGTDKLLINGVQALNSKCELTCIKGGGRVYIIDDGQENAVAEQTDV